MDHGCFGQRTGESHWLALPRACKAWNWCHWLWRHQVNPISFPNSKPGIGIPYSGSEVGRIKNKYFCSPWKLGGLEILVFNHKYFHFPLSHSSEEQDSQVTTAWLLEQQGHIFSSLQHSIIQNGKTHFCLLLRCTVKDDWKCTFSTDGESFRKKHPSVVAQF